MTDIVVYNAPNGRDYLGCFDGVWYIWPAEHDGWRFRRQASQADAPLSAEAELEPELSRLALRLSGAAR